MTDLEKMEIRWKQLVGKPRTKEEVEESLLLAKKIELERAKEYCGLIKELSDNGIEINSIWDLVNTKAKYPNAIEILLNYLSLVKYERNKEGIIRALTVTEAKGIAVPFLLKEYLSLPKEKGNLRWLIGNAVNTTISYNDVELILPIVMDKENGLSRQMFVSALGKIKSEKVEDVLINLLDDADVTRQAIEALGRLKSKNARDKIINLTKHPNALIKKEAKKALKKIL